MHADCATTMGAAVFLPLGYKERIHPLFLDATEVVDHAHAIPGAVSSVQVFQPFAGKFHACKTELRVTVTQAGTLPFQVCAFLVPCTAPDAAGSLFTGVALGKSKISAADRAIHSAGSDEIRIGCHDFQPVFVFRFITIVGKWISETDRAGRFRTIIR